MGHGLSWKFIYFISRIDGSLVQRHQIPWLFRIIYPGCICFPSHLKTWNGFLTSSNVMEFPWYLLRKLYDFHRIWCHCWPNFSQKDMRKSASHFLQGFVHRSCIFYFFKVWTRKPIKNVQTGQNKFVSREVGLSTKDFYVWEFWVFKQLSQDGRQVLFFHFESPGLRVLFIGVNGNREVFDPDHDF